LVALLLALAALHQGPAVSAAVDRTTVLAGDVITLTVRVEAVGNDPVRIADPVLTGFEARGSRDVTQVRVVDGQPRRVVTRELRLLAVAPGRATIGSVRVTQGTLTATTAAIAVTISAPGAGTALAVARRIRTLLDTLPPPGGSDVVVEVLALPSTVDLGDQLDLVTLAWFPRDLRQQLRTPPTLQPPDVEGVWSYQQVTVPGVAASRVAGTQWYDLFVSHQVVFPLTAGEVRVGRATVTYVQPLSYSFLSRELQHEVQSESITVAVREQPAADRPAKFSGAAGRDLTITLTAPQTTLPPGGAATVTATITGTGNVSLWPEPVIEWPGGLRVYPGEVSVEVTSRDGLVGGTKRFPYLIVADSAGTHPVPGVVYPYFDPVRHRYLSASTAGLQLVAPPGTVTAAPRALPPPLMERGAPDVSRRLARLATWVWVALFAVPPLALLVGVVLRRLRERRRQMPPRRPGALHPLDAVDRELRDALARLVGPASTAEGPPLAAALRAAGVDAGLSAHVVRVRERLRQAVFGPGGASDPEELTAEVREVLRALAGEAGGAERRQLLPLVTVLALLVWSGGLAAQGTRPEQLYEAGAFRAAADSFATRTAQQPDIAAYWYDLGAAYYKLGEDGRARAAWLRAARLAPRKVAIRRALALLPADRTSAAIAPVARVTPREALAAAALCWLAAWALLPWRRTRRIGLALAVIAAVAAVAAWRIDRSYQQPTAIVLRDDVPLRSAPFGSASAARSLVAGSAVRVDRAEGAWLLVERAGSMGWVLAGEVARL
jgi:hypothetical protein